MFVSCNGPNKNRVGRSVKMCYFYACFTLIGSWMGRKIFRLGISLNIKLVRVELQETNNIFFLGLRLF